MARRGDRLLFAAAALLLGITGAAAEDASVNTIQDVFQHLRTCWKPPPPSKARPIDITVVVSFNRAGNILGHPRITYESAEASDSDRLQYRIAVMEALQRCTPMPFTDAMAGAAAGRPFAIQFRNRKTSPDKTSPPTQERRA
ncbi:hypothetical protein ABIC09_004880 [Bradyrhizobium sp. S3.12.5]|uniref:hypothetical protein n=1 Tax=Bradyrhizobium sp. S3.12.5 TaxID=3156386 RepID=UPI0033925166